MTIPTVALNESSPAGSDNKAQGDDRIREYKRQVRQIMEIDHTFPSTGQSSDSGKHKKVSLVEQSDIGTGATGYAFIGGQTVSGKPELIYTDEDDNDVQLTSAGKICALGNGQPYRSNDTLFSLNSTTPTGWTDATSTYNGKFFRFSTSTAGSTGGSDSHDHGAATGGTTLTVDQIPAHGHDVSVYAAGGTATVGAGDGGGILGTARVSDAGGGTSHNHTISSVSHVPSYVQGKIYVKT